jgi:hypothetical protein
VKERRREEGFVEKIRKEGGAPRILGAFSKKAI